MRYTRPAIAAVAVAVVALALLTGQGVLARLTVPGATSGETGSERAGAATQTPAASRSAATPTPKVEVRLAEPTVKQYGRLKLSAEGFAPGESVTVAVKPSDDGMPIELGQAQADDQGKIGEFGADLPDGVNSGPRPVYLTGATSGYKASVVLYVRSQKLFAMLSSYNPGVADKLGFVVGGFEPGEEVQVYLGSTTGTPLATMPTDQAGNTGWAEITLPVGRPGEQELIFQGSQGKNQYVQRLTIAPLTPTLELSPWSGPPGSKFELNGRGFLPGEEVQVFVGRSNQPATAFKADQYGNFWGIGPLTVPADTGGGPADVRLVGQQSSAEVTQGFAVVGVKPWAELSSYSGPPGSVVSFSGGGFAAKERLTVHLGNAGGPVVATAETDETGHVVQSGAASVPTDTTSGAQTSATYTIVGESSGGQASAVFTVINPVIPRFNGERPTAP